MIESELKFKIENEETIKEKIKQLNVTIHKEIEQEDIYLDFKDMRLYKEDKALRLRKEDGKFFITFKGKRKNEKIKTRREIVVQLNSKYIKKILSLFKELGLKPVIKIKKKREIFRINNFEIAIDKVENIGNFVEVEILKENNKYELKELLDKLGLNDIMLVNETYPEIINKIKH
ncbi:MAG: class IV adenylate cyclase [Thermoproteota archaeon]|jgi:adenylyl cyclase CyaB, putative